MLHKKMKCLDDKLWEILASQTWIKNKELKNNQFVIVQIHSVQICHDLC